jgi:hypothetical protein
MSDAANLAATLTGGLLTFAGGWALGRFLLRGVAADVDRVLTTAAAPIVGIAAWSLGVELIALAGQASPGTLRALWIALAVAGAVFAAMNVSRWRWSPPRRGIDRLFVAMAVVASVATLVVALAPASKIDDLYYGMLLPARIVRDGGLQFYRLPWESTAPAQMLYQIGQAPLAAIGLRDAANVVSWAFGVLLIVTAYRFVLDAGSASDAARTAATACAAVISVGLYPASYYAAASAMSISDLAGALSLLAIVTAGTRPADQRIGLATLAAVLGACAAAGKLSAWPVGAGVTIIALWVAATSGRFRRVVMIVSVWAALLGPALAWTFATTGSPLGAMTAPAFPNAIFDRAERDLIGATYQINQWRWGLLRDFAFAYSPAFWLVAFGDRLAAADVRRRHAIALVVLGAQTIIMVIALPHSVRFLAGSHLAVVMLGASALATGATRIRLPRWSLGVAAILMPWLAVQLWYASSFAPVVAGLESRAAFEGRVVAFTRDFRVLDSLLPPTALLLMSGARGPSIYAPRLLFLDQRDLPPGGHVFLFNVGVPVRDTFASFRVGEVRYRNDSAIAEAYRTPGRISVVAPLSVVELIPR